MQYYFTLLAATVLAMNSLNKANLIPQEKQVVCFIAGDNKNIREEKWKSFWKDFTAAIHTKDKKRISELTSKDFFDGGGGTVQEWLDAEVYYTNKSFIEFKNTLQKGVRLFKGFDDSPYKATGKNNSGDLFFEYRNGQWLFGGIVGD